MRKRQLSICCALLILACNPQNKAVLEAPEGNPTEPVESVPDMKRRVPCAVGDGVCEGPVSRYCIEDGTVISEYCDEVQGSSCDAKTHRCTGPCSRAQLGASYIGCEYFPTITGNGVDATAYHFGVAISNTTSFPAEINIEGERTRLTLVVPPQSVQVQILPWVYSLVFAIFPLRPDTLVSDVVQKGAFRLRSTQPVTVYQFNPVEYSLGGPRPSYSSDASLLLPVNALGRSHRVVTWPTDRTNPPSPGLLAVTATQDQTNVTLTTKASTKANGALPSFEAGVPRTLALNRGDVVQLFNAGGTDDFTGSLIESDKPVQVIAGHYCTTIPLGSFACDHLEDVMFPVETLGFHYFVTAPMWPYRPLTVKPQWVRVVAIQDSTVLTFDPPQSVPTVLHKAGDFVEIPRNGNDFLITANRKILVSQFMASQQEGGTSGDPAMALVVPTEQHRREYLFYSSTTYPENYANVVAPVGARLVVDGWTVSGFQPIGASGYGVARLVLDTGKSGAHFISGDRPFGLSVYGYGGYTSYWYPAGLELNPIP